MNGDSMPFNSPIWHLTPQEAYENPYEFDAQSAFLAEAQAMLESLFLTLDKHNMRFRADDRSREKAQWLLYNNAHDGLKEACVLLHAKKHRIVAMLFRDVYESIELAEYFATNSTEASDDLQKWYRNEVVMHRQYRQHIRKILGHHAAQEKAAIFHNLSMATHHSYRHLLNSYIRATGGLLLYDSHLKSEVLVLPQTISQYMAVLGQLIRKYGASLARSGLAS
jgi:hypothetical protein